MKISLSIFKLTVSRQTIIKDIGLLTCHTSIQRPRISEAIDAEAPLTLDRKIQELA